MFDADAAKFFEGGCALIIGTVDAAGAPRATRGWGITVGDGEAELRLMLAASDRGTLEDLEERRRIAVTGADVVTLRSMQLKGRARALEPATDADRQRVREYCDEFLGDIQRTDGTPRELLDRMVPADFVACTLAVDELYDQTPGPSAGAPVAEDGA